MCVFVYCVCIVSTQDDLPELVTESDEDRSPRRLSPKVSVIIIKIIRIIIIIMTTTTIIIIIIRIIIIIKSSIIIITVINVRKQACVLSFSLSLCISTLCLSLSLVCAYTRSQCQRVNVSVCIYVRNVHFDTHNSYNR